MDISIRIAGAAGQGMQTAAEVLGRTLARAGLHAFIHQDIESRIRGGINFSQVRAGSAPVFAPTDRVDVLLAFTPESLRAFAAQAASGGLVFAAAPVQDVSAQPVHLGDIARAAGNEKTVSTVAAAIAACLLGVDEARMAEVLERRFSGAVLEANRKALSLSYEALRAQGLEGRFRLETFEKAPEGRLFVSGAQAAALGALAGGCTFMAAYPMSPATGIMAQLAELTHECGLWVEQAEDEIAAINMVAGASYAGVRAMTATSGGGFALMTEGVSLLGMIESPAVIVVAQRPGPATGLPTRTAQGDLRLVLHAGHGQFARVILAPRTIAEAFEVTARAFDLAERFQIPAFVLTDQLLQDGQSIVEEWPIPPVRRCVLSGEEAERLEHYERYALTENGISPMALPGASRHLVVVDSDEHDTAGHLTEDAALSRAMAEKRLRKMATLAAEAPLPECTQHDPALPLVIAWGSSAPAVAEAIAMLAAEAGRPVCNLLQFVQLWPLPDLSRIPAFASASRRIVVEHGVGDGLAGLIAQTQIVRVDAAIGKLDGRPFTVEELAQRIRKEVFHG